MATRYLLDTNICIYFAKHNPPTVRERCRQPTGNVGGQARRTAVRDGKGHAKTKALATIERLNGAIRVAEPPATAAEHCGRIGADLRRKVRPIGENDLLLAAHASAAGWILVSNISLPDSRPTISET